MNKCFVIDKFFEQIPALENESNKRLAVYTAIFSSYDKLKEPKFIDSEVDYYCFTDDNALMSENWNVIFLPILYRDPRLSARALKLLSHRILGSYEISIWVDGTCKIIDSMEDLVDIYCKEENICTFRHPKRNCIYQEARVCQLLGKDDPKIIKKQMEKYSLNGYPKENGLIESTVLIRRNKKKDVKKLNEEWWKNIKNHSCRDQLSFNYVAWRHSVPFKILEGNVSLDSFFTWVPHHKMIFYSKDGQTINLFLSKVTNFYLKFRLAIKLLLTAHLGK